MSKYHFNVFLKNDNFMHELPGSKKIDMDEYVVSFKGLFDSLKEGFDYIYKHYTDIMKEKGYNWDDVSDCMNIVKIKTELLTKYEEMFFSKLK